jgi:hypothetical protein
MSYQIGFYGAASAELSQLLHAVGGHLNGRGLHIMGQADAQAQTTSASTVQPRDPWTRDCCGCHDTVIVLVTAVVVVVTAIFAGSAGFLTGRHMYKVKGPNI